MLLFLAILLLIVFLGLGFVSKLFFLGLIAAAIVFVIHLMSGRRTI
jgi:hypothetical protein